MQRTTIALARHVRDRLLAYGRKGQTYERILEELMDRVSPQELWSNEPFTATRYFSQGEVDFARSHPVGDRIRLMDRMRTAAERVNPEGARRLVASRRTSRPSR
jgi:hypothetical protein